MGAHSAKLSVPHSENITRVQLTNGITVLVYENFATQSIVLSGSLLGGAVFETPVENGLASFVSAGLMRGTQHRDFEMIHSALEDVGADLGISSGTHRVSFQGKALAEDLPLLIDLLNDSLRFPLFPDAQMERMRGERLTWLQYQETDSRRQVAKAFRENLYTPTHPYYYSPRGTLETVPTLSVDAMRAFHAKHYGPKAMTLCVVGAVQARDVVDLVYEYMGDWYNPYQPDEPPLPEVELPSEIRRVIVPLPGKSQTDIMLGVIGPSRLAPDYQAASLANSVLGQFGMMGRIGEAVREKSGMAYYAYSRLEGGVGPGAWLVTMGVNPKNIERAIALSLDEVNRMLQAPIEAGELLDNQNYYVRRLPLQLESNEGLCGVILTMETYQLGLDYLLHYEDTIMRLKPEDLRAALHHYWNMDAYVLAIAGSPPE